MVPHTRTLTDHERSDLLRFEAVYEQWRVAREAQSASERRLWQQTLEAKDSDECARLRTETVRLRVIARDAYANLLSLLEQLE